MPRRPTLLRPVPDHNERPPPKDQMNVETANRISSALRIHDEYEALHAAAQQLVKIVEGVAEPHGGWRSKQRCGLRLKDTPEWALFYCAFKDTEAKSSNSRDEQPGALAVQEAE